MDTLIVRLFVEFLGTFVFLSVIIGNSSNPIAIVVGLLAAIYFGGAISGGHFNPAVTCMANLNSKITNAHACGYIIAQLFGAVCAYYFYGMSQKHKIN